MDKILRAITDDGMIKMAAITARDMIERARSIHGCTPTTSAALGRTLCAASLMGNMMKEEKGSLTLRIDGGGATGMLIAVSDSAGNVRGCIADASVELPLRPDGKLDVGGAVGANGMLTVSRDIGLREPYIGSTELVSGEIAEDVTRYLLESEQVPSACALGVLVDTDRTIKAAGGFIVQLMPGADEALIDTLEENIFLMDQLTTVLDEDGAEELFAQVLKGLPYQLVEECPVEYRCSCSRERLSEALRCVDRAELEDMIEAGETVEVVCDFCKTRYAYTPAELTAILAAKNED